MWPFHLFPFPCTEQTFAFVSTISFTGENISIGRTIAVQWFCCCSRWKWFRWLRWIGIRLSIWYVPEVHLTWWRQTFFFPPKISNVFIFGGATDANDAKIIIKWKCKTMNSIPIRAGRDRASMENATMHNRNKDSSSQISIVFFYGSLKSATKTVCGLDEANGCEI